MTTTDVQRTDYGRPERYQQKLELTPEEAKAWHACMRNSSFLTPALISGGLGYGFFRLTPFRAQAKYAAFVGGVLGLITGRIAISELCLAKVAAMPNSTLRERLAEAGNYRNRAMSERHFPSFQSPAGVATDVPSSEETSAPGIVFDEYLPMNSYDTYSSLNDSGDVQTSEDTDLTEPINLQKSVSYDELRDKNRDEYYRKNRRWYAPGSPERPSAVSETPRQAPQQASVDPPPTQEKTKYGDVWG